MAGVPETAANSSSVRSVAAWGSSGAVPIMRLIRAWVAGSEEKSMKAAASSAFSEPSARHHEP